MIAAAQRQNALANYAAGGKGTQAFAALNRLVEVDLRGRIIGGVEFHLAQGDSWRQLRKTLQNSVELTKSRAQTVARTEMAAAMVEGSKLRYEAEGIEQVQWQAVGSSRTCGYCAPRHGKVYRLGEVVAPAHPNCRCTVTPWDPEWEELGLIDPQEEAKARAEVLADLEAAGKKPISGPSPFEKALGQERAPKALWSPPSTDAIALKSQPQAQKAPAKKSLGKMSNAELVKELEEEFDLPVPAGLQDDRQVLLQELAERRGVTLNDRSINEQADALLDELESIAPAGPRKVQGAYSKLQKEFEAPGSQQLGKGNAGEVVVAEDGSVIKWGQIGEFEAEALKALDGTGVAPRLIDYEDLQIDARPGAGSAADRSLAFVGRYDGLIKMSRAEGVPFEVWKEQATPTQIQEAKEAFLEASKKMHLKGVAHNDRHDVNFLVFERDGSPSGLFVDFGAAQVDARAALIEAMGNTSSKRDFQATYIGTQDGQAQGSKWERFERNLSLVQDLLARQPNGSQVLRQTVRTSTETLDKLITEEQAANLLKILYGGV
ncbi:MAG: minor capsid protein [Vulcanococcus sp.]